MINSIKIPHQFSFYGMARPHKTVVVSLMKWIIDQVCHVNIKPLTVKTPTYPIESPLVILLYRMARPLKLCKSQSQMLVTLTFTSDSKLTGNDRFSIPYKVLQQIFPHETSMKSLMSWTSRVFVHSLVDLLSPWALKLWH